MKFIINCINSIHINNIFNKQKSTLVLNVWVMKPDDNCWTNLLLKIIGILFINKIIEKLIYIASAFVSDCIHIIIFCIFTTSIKIYI